MSSLRLDQVHLSSFHEAFRNREILHSTIAIVGTVGAGNTVNFDTSFSIQRELGIVEVYYEKIGGNPRRKADSGVTLYNYSGPGNASVLVSYTNPTTVRVRFRVFNPTGSSISLTTQGYDITAYVFDTPFS